MSNKPLTKIPLLGQWPVGPQTDVQVSKDKIWIDGCFDFNHHGILIDYVVTESIFLRVRWSNFIGATTRQVFSCRSLF